MPNSLVARALGARFESLHPEVRARHAFAAEDGQYSIGEGVMDRVWSGSALFAPFLAIGARRNIMFPESGRDVPFRIECWAYRDGLGRETLSLNRTYFMEQERRFDEFLVDVPEAPGLIIYVGNHQHLAVEIEVAASKQGGVEFRTRRQRLMTPLGALRFPLPLSAEATVHEWFDEELGQFRIDGRVRNRLFGDVFGAVGCFESRLAPVPNGGPPRSIRPVVEEARW